MCDCFGLSEFWPKLLEDLSVLPLTRKSEKEGGATRPIRHAVPWKFGNYLRRSYTTLGVAFYHFINGQAKEPANRNDEIIS